MTVKTQEVTAGSRRYEITQLGAAQSLELFLQITKTVGPSLAEVLAHLPGLLSEGGLDEAAQAALPGLPDAVRELCSKLSLNEFQHMIELLAKQTLIIKDGEQGQTKQQLSRIMEAEFGGELDEQFKWLAAALKVNYGSFLGGSGLLDRVASIQAAAKASQSPST